jgi:hypothetical protein
MPSCLHLSETSLIQRRGGSRRRSGRLDSNFAGGSPTFAAVHQRISKMISIGNR